MIHLITGTPGAGKTLYAIAQLSKIKKRPIYYNGIPGIVPELGWIELPDVTKWMHLPPNSILLIDEAQRIFPTRPKSAHIPEFVAALSTQRHNGIDIYLISQSAMLIDVYIRRLIGHHVFLRRLPGQMACAVAYSTNHLLDENRLQAVDVEKSNFVYPKKIYKLYKSADLHTKTTKLPKKLLLLPLAVIVAVAFIIYAVGIMQKTTGAPEPKNFSNDAETMPGNTKRMPATKEAYDYSQHLSDYDPRKPYPAPTPNYRDVPRIAGCIKADARCVCYTQQAIILPSVRLDTCIRISRFGYHDLYAHYSSDTITTNNPTSSE